MSSTASGPTAVVLSGDLTLRAIGPAHAELSQALTGHTAVTVAVDKAAGVDLSLVQLLCAARQTAEEAGGSFAMAEPATGALLEILRRGGFVATADQRQFWLNEGGDPR